MTYSQVSPSPASCNSLSFDLLRFIYLKMGLTCLLTFLGDTKDLCTTWITLFVSTKSYLFFFLFLLKYIYTDSRFIYHPYAFTYILFFFTEGPATRRK
ncbi:uncharacterized protein EV154DRAFT_525706 [Mucor mucedo]|uniref:uncharacterized protein n=1 Tax=Mucor mucedo TaxID=29922 RepID=UPI0022205D4A|nr:uncharacterized protein EV154DRAFT_525706 [Mucor mucedo]KAI7876796.1 hypothetical protein EV154DRAFT_525706 [Mucor mucedo]